MSRSSSSFGSVNTLADSQVNLPSEDYSPVRNNMKQLPGFISTIELGQYKIVNTPSGATSTADVKLKPAITNVSNIGLSRAVTTQIANTGSYDVHNMWVKVEVFLQGSRVKLDGQDYLRVDIGTVKPRQYNKISYKASAFSEQRLSSVEIAQR